MTDRRKLNPKPGQHLGKRIRNPKKQKKNKTPVTRQSASRDLGPLAEWERELLGLTDYTPVRSAGRSRNPRRRS